MKNEAKLYRDVKNLIQLIKIFCDNKHKSLPKNQWNPKKNYLKNKSSLILCQECSDLLDYSIKQRENCPLDPKPICKKCEIHCYSSNYRLRIKEVMRYSSIYLLTHGRVDLIFYLLI